MRILYFSRDYTTHDRRFLAKIAERHRVFFLRLENDGVAYEERPLPDGVQVVPWGAGGARFTTPESWLRLMPAYQKAIDQVRPDLIHAGPVQSCGFMTALAGYHPFLLMSWGSDVLVDADRDEFHRWMTCFVLSRCDLFACDCAEVAEKAGKLAEYPRERVIQFPWGVNLSQFSPGPDSLTLKSSLGWQGTVLAISTRSWADGYGLETLLEAFRRAHTVNSRLRLILAGDGPLAATVRRFIERHGLSAVVELPGRIANPRLPEYFRAADVYLSCAPSDGSSVSLLEAMATGLPVVIADRPSNREWVTHGANGWLCASDQPSTFASALVEAASLTCAQRQSFAARNRSIAEQRANWDLNSRKLLDAYEIAASLPARARATFRRPGANE